MPRNALVLLLSLFYPTLQPAIGECVLLVELKATFVVEETTPIFWRDVFDPVAGHNVGGELHKVLLARPQPDALVPHHRELRWLADEQVESGELLVKAAEGDRVGVEVQSQPQPIPLSLVGLHLRCLHISLKGLDQVLVLGLSQRILNVEGTAHASVSGHPEEQLRYFEAKNYK